MMMHRINCVCDAAIRLLAAMRLLLHSSIHSGGEPALYAGIGVSHSQLI